MDLLEGWADAPLEAVSPSLHCIISACLSDSRSHVKLKAVTDALFKVSSKMVLKCVTQLFQWCGQGVYGKLVFPLELEGGFETRGHYVIPAWMSNEKKKNEKHKQTQASSTGLLHLYQDIIPLDIFYIKPCLFHQPSKITAYDPGPGKLKQEQSRAERIIAFQCWLSLDLLATSAWQLNGLREKEHFRTARLCVRWGGANWWKFWVKSLERGGGAVEKPC